MCFCMSLVVSDLALHWNKIPSGAISDNRAGGNPYTGAYAGIRKDEYKPPQGGNAENVQNRFRISPQIKPIDKRKNNIWLLEETTG